MTFFCKYCPLNFKVANCKRHTNLLKKRVRDNVSDLQDLTQKEGALTILTLEIEG